MQHLNFFAKLLKAVSPSAKTDDVTAAPTDSSSSEAGQAPGESGYDTALGVKYNCKFSWQIQPPAGWQRQESGMSAAWPASGSSPCVTFLNTAVLPGESELIRWQLSGSPTDLESHEQLARLIDGQSPLAPQAVRGLIAPGLVTSMKVTEVDRVVLSGGLPALIIWGRYLDLKGEEPLLRYVIVLPDRVLKVRGEVCFFRETIQFVATEASFWAHEKMAIASLKTFRRSDESKTAEEKGFVSGSFPTATSAGLR